MGWSQRLKRTVFKNRLKPLKTVRISRFIWQRVTDCRASVAKSPTAVRAKSAARNSETITITESMILTEITY